MNNWTIYQIVNYLINKEQTGNTFNAEEFQMILNHSSLKLFKRRLGMPEEYQMQTAYTQQGYANTTRILVDLEDFIKRENLTYTSGITNNPTDMEYPIGMKYKQANVNCTEGYKSIIVELVNAGELIMRESSSLKEISYDYPVYEIANGTLRIYPNTIQHTDFTYLKTPLQAVFATTTNATTGEEEYDASSSTELEWNDLAKLDIISIILASVGLNLRSNEILQTAEMYKEKGL